MLYFHNTNDLNHYNWMPIALIAYTRISWIDVLLYAICLHNHYTHLVINTNEKGAEKRKKREEKHPTEDKNENQYYI